MKLRDYPDVDVDLTANAYHCVEDDETFDLGAGEEFDEDDTPCPYDAGHYVAPVHLTVTIPDGMPQEIAAEYWHYGNKRYEFALENA